MDTNLIIAAVFLIAVVSGFVYLASTLFKLTDKSDEARHVMGGGKPPANQHCFDNCMEVWNEDADHTGDCVKLCAHRT